MSTLAEELSEGPTRDPDYRCAACVGLVDADADDRAEIEAAISSASWTDRELTEFLNGRGWGLKATTIRHHRQTGHRA